MAKFTPGPAVAEVRGSVGGTTFSRNRYGAYMRFRAKPTVATSEEAIAAKARMTNATTGWQFRTAAQRLAWNQWARENPIVGSLGFPQAATGHAAFVGSSCRMQLLGETPLVLPPITPPYPALDTMSVVADKTAGTCNITFTPALAPTEILIVRACQVASSGISYIENLLRWCHASGAAPPSPWDVFSEVEARIGALVVGYQFFCLVYRSNRTNALQSAPLRATDTVV